MFDTYLSELDCILSGYVLPEPIFSNNLNILLGKVFSILLNPLLPALQFQKYLDVIDPMMSNILLNDLQLVIGQYTSNFSSLFSRFPSCEIKSIIEKYLNNIDDNTNRLNMAIILRPMLELAEMYSDGIRSNAKFIIEKLLLDYLRVEIKFQEEETLIIEKKLNPSSAAFSVEDRFFCETTQRVKYQYRDELTLPLSIALDQATNMEQLKTAEKIDSVKGGASTELPFFRL